jgi:hypothetical protein
MNIFDSEPCDDKINKFRITCGEVYTITHIIECCKHILSIDLIESGNLNLNMLQQIIPMLMKSMKSIIRDKIGDKIGDETKQDMYYFYVSSLNEKIKKYMQENENKLKLSVDDLCVISRKKCINGIYDTSQQYKVYIYVKELLLFHPHSQQAI